MKQTRPFAISISRQIGSGGAYLGLQLAKKLNYFYADREIIRKAAAKLSVLEEDIEDRDERISSFWQAFMQTSAFSPDVYVPQKSILPTDRELFEAESKVIEHITREHSSVIIGRCGFYVLRGYPEHVSIFLYGDHDARVARVQRLNQITDAEASTMVDQSDKSRAQYCKTFTGKEWTDARNYDLSIDTSKLGLDKAVELVLDFLKVREGLNV